MIWSEGAKKGFKVLVILVVLAAFAFPMLIAIRYVALWQIYGHFVDTISNVTGLNQYLVTAASALLFIPFFVGVSWSLKVWNKRRRNAGVAILLILFVFYNLGLFYFTRDTYFAFAKGEALKFYALTPEGVKFYDRAGVDQTYGITLKPVTPDVIRKLKLLEKGEFKPVDPSRVNFFNPITGDAQAWYYRYPDGAVEFYDKPGHHPLTGATLAPVTQQIVLEWRKIQIDRLAHQGPSPAIVRAEKIVRVRLLGTDRFSEAVSLEGSTPPGSSYVFEGPADAKVRFDDGTEGPITKNFGVKGGRVRFSGPASEEVVVKFFPPRP